MQNFRELHQEAFLMMTGESHPYGELGAPVAVPPFLGSSRYYLHGGCHRWQFEVAMTAATVKYFMPQECLDPGQFIIALKDGN
jgi:hypothetical protein